MRYGWEIVGVAVLGALAYSLVPETTYAKCDLMSEGSETSEQYFKLSSLRYPWTVFIGHDAILTGGAAPLPSYVELARVSGVGYMQADASDAPILLSSLSGKAAFSVQEELYSGTCRQISVVFP